jgi:integrase
VVIHQLWRCGALETVLAIEKLEDTHLRTLKRGATRKSDGGGLYLLPAKKDGESHGWRFDYSFQGKRRTISLGVYPAVSLAEARDRAGACRTAVAKGQDPSALRRLEKQKTIERLEAERRLKAGEPIKGSFEEVARRWYADIKDEWADSYSGKVLRRLEIHAFPYIGAKAIEEVTAADVLALCRRVQAEGRVQAEATLETGQRVRELCSRVFCYAIGEQTLTSDPARDIRRSLKKPRTRHFPAITKPVELAELLRDIDSYSGSFVVRCVLQLAPMLMVRPGELRLSRWEEFDLDQGLWIVPSMRLKRTLDEKENGEPHLVWLPRQAVQILEELFQLTGRTGYVFAGQGRKNKTISNNTLNKALRCMGYSTKTEVTGHGFRATARTLVVELLEFPEAVAEMQLAHAVKDANGTAYNRAEFHRQRMKMMQDWADYLEDLKNDRAKVKHPVLTEFKPVTLRLATINQAFQASEA